MIADFYLFTDEAILWRVILFDIHVLFVLIGRWTEKKSQEKKSRKKSHGKKVTGNKVTGKKSQL